MKKITQILFTLLLSCVATNAFAATITLPAGKLCSSTTSFKAGDIILLRNYEGTHYVYGSGSSHVMKHDSNDKAAALFNLTTQSADDGAQKYLWLLEDAGEGKFYLKNVNLKEYAGTQQSANTAIPTKSSKDDAGKYSITFSTKSGNTQYFDITCEENYAGSNKDFHACHNGSQGVIIWNTYTNGANQSGWSIVKFTEKTVTEVTYTVAVTGITSGGGVTYDSKDYKDGETFKAPENLSVADLKAIVVDGYDTKISISNTTITVKYIASLDASKQYYMRLKNETDQYINLTCTNVVLMTTTPDVLAITKKTNSTWTIKNGSSRYLGISSWYAYQVSDEFEWTVEGNMEDGYTFYQSSSNKGYLGAQWDKDKSKYKEKYYCNNGASNAYNVFVFEEVKTEPSPVKAGHFYTFNDNRDGDKWYVFSTNSMYSGKELRLGCGATPSAQHNNIFYYNNNVLQGYTNGKFVKCTDKTSSEWQAQLDDNSGDKVSFPEAPTEGLYRILFTEASTSDRFIMTSDAKNYLSAGTGTISPCGQFAITDVTENIYTVSFVNAPDGAAVKLGEDRAVVKGSATPWIYSATALGKEDLTVTTPSGYSSSVTISEKNIIVTYTKTPSIDAGMYTLVRVEIVSYSPLTINYYYLNNLSGTISEEIIVDDKYNASHIFNINGAVVKSQGVDVSSNFSDWNINTTTQTVKFGGQVYSIVKVNNGTKKTTIPVYNNGKDNKYFSTICAPFDIELPEGFEAYSASIDGDKIKLTTQGSSITEGNPVLIYGTSETAISVIKATIPTWAEYTSDVTPSDGNSFSGSFLQSTYNGGYVLGLKNDVFAFYKMAESATIGANKTFLNATSTAKGFSIVFDDDPTAIYNLLDGQLIDKNAPIYNLSGQRVNQMQKGVNIVNGRKVLY